MTTCSKLDWLMCSAKAEVVFVGGGGGAFAMSLEREVGICQVKMKPRGIPGRREEESKGAEAGPLQVDEQVVQGCSVELQEHR